VEEKLARALLQFKEKPAIFKFVRVVEVSKFWRENGLWQTAAVIEYEFEGKQKRQVSFQIGDEGKIVGFNLFEPFRG